LRPFLDQYLKDGAPKADVPPVVAFETGTNTWRRLTSWPAGCASGCTVKPTPLYMKAGLKLSFTEAKPSAVTFEEYISDPAKPCPTALGLLTAPVGRAGWLMTSAKRRTSGCTGVRFGYPGRTSENQR